MTETIQAFPELELIDKLIAGLEALIAESDETPLTIEANKPPKRAIYRIIGTSTPIEKKRIPCEAVYLDAGKLVLRCNNTEAVRQMQLEVAVQAEKSGRGETMAIIRGKVAGTKRVRGGYDLEVDVGEMRKTRITPVQKLRECLGKKDPAAWNRWCQDIRGAIELVGMDLTRADLTGYDLCCTDLTGSDLSGANLSGAVLAGADLSDCTLDQAIVVGADFFRAKMKRSQASVLTQAGMPEVESVVFEE